ncbi:MAG: hypothetical protein ACKV0T_00795 [Planctomycetales bacterium]
MSGANWWFLLRLARLCLLILTTLSTLPAYSGTTVDGDVGLLRLVRDAQLTNAAQFQRGEMHVEINSKDIGLRVDALIVWDGEMGFWDYEALVPVKGDGKVPIQRTTQKERGRFIDDGRIRSFYLPDARLAQIVDNKSIGYRQQLKVRPSDLWFVMEGVHRWSELLDPDRDAPGYTMAVRKEGSTQIVIERREPRGGVLTVVVDISKDCNIVKYESVPPPGNDQRPEDERSFWRAGVYDWEKDNRGAWYLRRHWYQCSSAGSPSKLDYDFEFEVTSFNPTPDILRNRFQSESLELPVGTIVEMIGSNPRTYRVGQEDNAALRELDPLSEVLRRKAFIRGTKK